jgi:hypothetical protein
MGSVMKVKVLSMFEDKRVKGRFYRKDQVVEFAEKRAMDLIARGLAAKVNDAEATVKAADETKMVGK